jgi:hypothetical protein
MCGSYMLEFSVSKDMRKNAVDFGRRAINEQEGEAPSLRSLVR